MICIRRCWRHLWPRHKSSRGKCEFRERVCARHTWHVRIRAITHSPTTKWLLECSKCRGKNQAQMYKRALEHVRSQVHCIASDDYTLLACEPLARLLTHTHKVASLQRSDILCVWIVNVTANVTCQQNHLYLHSVTPFSLLRTCEYEFSAQTLNCGRNNDSDNDSGYNSSCRCHHLSWLRLLITCSLYARHLDGASVRPNVWMSSLCVFWYYLHLLYA